MYYVFMWILWVVRQSCWGLKIKLQRLELVDILLNLVYESELSWKYNHYTDHAALMRRQVLQGGARYILVPWPGFLSNICVSVVDLWTVLICDLPPPLLRKRACLLHCKCAVWTSPTSVLTASCFITPTFYNAGCKVSWVSTITLFQIQAVLEYVYVCKVC